MVDSKGEVTVTDSIDAYDQRQLDLMEGRIALFKRRSISLSKLINDLDALLLTLRSADVGWIDAFKIEWGTLEQMHAGSLDRGFSEVPAEFMQPVDQAISNMTVLLSNAHARLRSASARHLDTEDGT